MSGEPMATGIKAWVADGVNHAREFEHIIWGATMYERHRSHSLLSFSSHVLFPAPHLTIRMDPQNDDCYFPFLHNANLLQDTLELDNVISSGLDEFQPTSGQAPCYRDWTTYPLTATPAYDHLSQVPQVLPEPPRISPVSQNQQVVSLLRLQR